MLPCSGTTGRGRGFLSGQRCRGLLPELLPALGPITICSLPTSMRACPRISSAWHKPLPADRTYLMTLRRPTLSTEGTHPACVRADPSTPILARDQVPPAGAANSLGWRVQISEEPANARQVRPFAHLEETLVYRVVLTIAGPVAGGTKRPRLNVEQAKVYALNDTHDDFRLDHIGRPGGCNLPLAPQAA